MRYRMCRIDCPHYGHWALGFLPKVRKPLEELSLYSHGMMRKINSASRSFGMGTAVIGDPQKVGDCLAQTARHG